MNPKPNRLSSAYRVTARDLAQPQNIPKAIVLGAVLAVVLLLPVIVAAIFGG